jgi:hypothetical protein
LSGGSSACATVRKLNTRRSLSSVPANEQQQSTGRGRKRTLSSSVSSNKCMVKRLTHYKSMANAASSKSSLGTAAASLLDVTSSDKENSTPNVPHMRIEQSYR